jgi:hypothetical protein
LDRIAFARRSYSSAASTMTAALPCLVIRCGRRAPARAEHFAEPRLCLLKLPLVLNATVLPSPGLRCTRRSPAHLAPLLTSLANNTARTVDHPGPARRQRRSSSPAAPPAL